MRASQEFMLERNNLYDISEGALKPRVLTNILLLQSQEILLDIRELMLEQNKPVTHTPIMRFHDILSAKTMNALMDANVTSVEKLLENIGSIQYLKGIGTVAMKECQSLLASL